VRWLVLFVLVAAGAALGACGGGEPLVEQRSGGEKTTTSVPPPPTRTATTPVAPPKPTTAPADTGVETRAERRRFIYSDARALCERFGVRQVVRIFGLKRGGSATAVARSYARENYSEPFQDAGYRGCLAGFNG
jgi:hypothetical protein